MHFRFLRNENTNGRDRRRAQAAEHEVAALRNLVAVMAESHTNTLNHFANKTRGQFQKGNTPKNKKVALAA